MVLLKMLKNFGSEFLKKALKYHLVISCIIVLKDKIFAGKRKHEIK